MFYLFFPIWLKGIISSSMSAVQMLRICRESVNIVDKDNYGYNKYG